MTQEELFGLLHEVAHPELHNDIVTLGMVENPVVTDDKIQLTRAAAIRLRYRSRSAAKN